MKLSTKGRYAVTAMMDLAIHDRDGPVTLADISNCQGISLSYLEQLFSKLRQSGLVEGVRGPGGGYRLARTADKISVADVIMAVDESIDSTRCKGDLNCNRGSRCLTHHLWNDLSDQLYDFLNNITLAEFIKNPEVKKISQRMDSTASRIANMFPPRSKAS
jgi:Rrf2 family iron-sulfur cluster assembly transcriptional regulator